jgi:SH3-like domain-containing protein
MCRLRVRLHPQRRSGLKRARRWSIRPQGRKRRSATPKASLSGVPLGSSNSARQASNSAPLASRRQGRAIALLPGLRRVWLPAPLPPAPPAERAPTIGSVTSLPLPRFAALRSDEVNMRSGPGTRFPIEWTYQRRELPVEIVREFELWRRIRDPEGTEGWVHQSTLMGRRSFIVRGAPGSEVMLRRRAEDQAQPVARLRPGVVGRLRACETNNPWCEAQIGEFRGYIKRADIWGVGPAEEVK